MKITSEKFMFWFVFLPTLLLGFHLGIVSLHIYESFQFIIPLFFRITGIISSLYVILCIVLYVLSEKSKWITITED